MSTTTTSLLPLSMSSVTSIDGFTQFYNEFISFNATSHFTCYQGRSMPQYLANCSTLHETGVYWPVVIVSFIICHMFEYVVRVLSYRTSVWKSLDPVESVRWHNKVVSYVHAWISTILVVHALLMEPHTWRDACHAYAPRYELVLAISVGYFLFDLFFFLRNRRVFGDNTSMVVHHLVCIIAITYCVAYRVGLFYNMCLLFTEVTTIFFHQQWFLSAIGYKNGKLYQLNGLLFWILFFFCRVVWCFLQNVHLYVFSYQFEFAPYIFRAPIVTPSILFFLNLYWFIIITKRVVQHGGKSPNNDSKSAGDMKKQRQQQQQQESKKDQ